MSIFREISSDEKTSILTWTSLLISQEFVDSIFLKHPGQELVALGAYYAVMLFVIMKTNKLEQRNISLENFGRIWSRNENAWLKSLTTTALIALPQLLLNFGPNLLHGVSGIAEKGEVVAISLALGLIIFEYGKDIIGFMLSQRFENEERESDERLKDFFDHLNENEFQQRTGRFSGRGSLPPPQVEKVERNTPKPDTNLKEKWKEYKEKSQDFSMNEEGVRDRYIDAIADVDMRNACVLGKKLGKSNKRVRNDFARTYHTDVGGSKGNTEVMQRVNVFFKEKI